MSTPHPPLEQRQGEYIICRFLNQTLSMLEKGKVDDRSELTKSHRTVVCGVYRHDLSVTDYQEADTY